MHMTQMRRPWTDDEVGKLLNMAQKYPSAQIASEIGRPASSVRTKAQQLAISLRMVASDRQSDPGDSSLDPN
jgi:hypothetical protein